MANYRGKTPLAQLSEETLRQMVQETPPAGKKRGVISLTVLAALGSLVFGYDIGVISGALPYMCMPYGAGGMRITPAQEGAIGGILPLGAAFGALLGGRLSDRYGRKHAMIPLTVLFVVGALGNAFAPPYLGDVSISPNPRVCNWSYFGYCAGVLGRICTPAHPGYHFSG